MHVTIRRYSHQCGAGSEFIAAIRSEFLPIIRKAPKFVDYYVIEEEAGSVTTLSIFEDEESALASNHLAAEWIKNSQARRISAPPVIVSGNVVAAYTPEK